MSPAQAAHLRLMHTIPPERVLKHDARPPNPTTGIYVARDLSQRRREAVAEMSGQINPATGKKWKLQEIADELHISKQAVSCHRRVLKGRPYTPRKGKR